MSEPEDDDGRTIVLPKGWAKKDEPVAEAMADYLVATAGSTPGRRLELTEAPVTIGRSPQHVLAFTDDGEMSRSHARVSLVAGEVVVEDLGSTNGTFIDEQRIVAPTPLREGSVLRVGHQRFKHERRSTDDVARSQSLERDLDKANRYVRSLLPAPLTSGPVLTDWRFVPSTKLGGDAFGYDWLDADTFVFYLIDVSGHGVGSAMHSVTVLNVLRQRALPNVSFDKPAEVLASLNDRFQMADHNSLYFTMWYGVYRPSTRSLTYASAAHHGAYLVPPDRLTAQAAATPAAMIGAIPNETYDVGSLTVPAGACLYLFSDGVFEITTRNGQQWDLADFEPLLVQPLVPDISEAGRLHRAVIDTAKPGPLADDFSLVVLTFP